MILFLFGAFFPESKERSTNSENIYAVDVDSAIAKSTVHKWFAKFRRLNFYLEDREW